MANVAQILLFLAIALSVLLFFGPIVVIVSLIGNVEISKAKIDVTKLSHFARAILAIIGVAIWLSVYAPLVLFAIAELGAPEVLSETSTTTSESEPTATHQPTAKFIVERVHIPLGLPEDVPLLISVSQFAHVTGKTEFMVGYDKHMWLFVCKRVTGDDRSCKIRKLSLGISSHKWNTFIEIGSPEDDCGRFEVGFAAVDKDTNSLLHDLMEQQPEVHYVDLPHDQFLDQEWYETKRELNDDYERICSNT